MKPPILSLIIACLFPVVLEAQSVADAARSERARRSAQTREGRLYTGVPEDARSRITTPTVVPAEAEAQVQVAPSDAVSGETAAETPPETEASSESVEDPLSQDSSTELEAQIAEQMEAIQDLEDRRVREVLEVNRLRSIFLAPNTSQSAQRQVQIEIDAAQNQLAETENALVEAEGALAELLAELDRVFAAAP